MKWVLPGLLGPEKFTTDQLLRLPTDIKASAVPEGGYNYTQIHRARWRQRTYRPGQFVTTPPAARCSYCKRVEKLDGLGQCVSCGAPRS